MPYKEPSIISGTGVVIWSKTNSGPTGHHHPWSSPLLRVCIVSSNSVIFCMHHASRILWGYSAPPVILYLDNSYVVFGKKFPAVKGSVRWCIVVM
jgi:hypothetical protein